MARQLACLSLKIRGKMFFESLYKMLIRFAYTLRLALLGSVRFSCWLRGIVLKVYLKVLGLSEFLSLRC